VLKTFTHIYSVLIFFLFHWLGFTLIGALLHSKFTPEKRSSGTGAIGEGFYVLVVCLSISLVLSIFVTALVF